jgi:hypothetical protein
MTKQSMVTRVARQILDAEIAKFEQYEADVADWYANGYGRSVAVAIPTQRVCMA